jgi:hypothetical protein
MILKVVVTGRPGGADHMIVGDDQVFLVALDVDDRPHMLIPDII